MKKLTSLFAVATVVVSSKVFAALEYDNSFNESLDMAKSGNSPVRSQDYSRDGDGWSMKSYLNRNTSAHKFRTEGWPLGWGNKRTMVWGRDYWIGFSILLPKGWKWRSPTDPNYGFTNIAQIHSYSSGHNGQPWGLRVESGKWRFQNRFGASYTAADVDDTIGKWQDVVVHMKPSMGPDGIFEVWFNGKHLGKFTGQNTFSGDELGPYPKFGIYNCWGNDKCQTALKEATLYHDVIKIASGPDAGYEDVAPRGKPPQVDPSR